MLRHPSDHTKCRAIEREDISEIEPLLVEVLRDGKPVADLPSIDAMRQMRADDVDRLDPGVKRLVNPHIYHVSLTERLWNLKQSVVESVVPHSGED